MTKRGDEIARPQPWTVRAADRRAGISVVTVGDRCMEQWQFEVTAGGRIWYGIDDTPRTLWITQAGTAHPRQTDRGRHR